LFVKYSFHETVQVNRICRDSCKMLPLSAPKDARAGQFFLAGE
jgi:hypothetical protein